MKITECQAYIKILIIKILIIIINNNQQKKNVIIYNYKQKH